MGLVGMMEDPRVLWWIQTLGYAFFAAVGGLMGYSLRTINTGQKIQWSRALMEAVASAFVGVLILFMCQALKFGPEWTGAIVGMAGWLGANVTISLLERVVRKKLGIDDRAPGGTE